jgi:hypothetical protein
VHALILDPSHRVQFPQHEFHQLGLGVLGHHGQAIDDHKCIETLVEPDLEFFFDIGKVDLRLVKLVAVAV